VEHYENLGKIGNGDKIGGKSQKFTRSESCGNVREQFVEREK